MPSQDLRVRQEGIGSLDEVDSDDVLILDGEDGIGEITAEDFLKSDHLADSYGNRQDRLELLYRARTRDGRRLEVEQKLKDLAAEPQYEDSSSGEAVDRLERTPGMISGETMLQAICDATLDADNRAASLEYNDLKRFVMKNLHRLSPEAREVFAIYECYARWQKRRGFRGIRNDLYDDMIAKMRTAVL